MSKKTAKLVVGQRVWYVPTEARRGTAHEAEVTKVGSKWAELTSVRDRIDVKTLKAEAALTGLSAGKCYLSQADHEADLLLRARWSEFSKKVEDKWQPPEGMTVERIEQAQQILFPESTGS
jgi:hypothetical protein